MLPPEPPAPTAASFPGAPPGRAVFEWTLDKAFLTQRTEAPDPAPDSLAIVTVDPRNGAYTQHYFDSRGVVRLYGMTLIRNIWTLTRDSPDFSPLDFHQRFIDLNMSGSLRQRVRRRSATGDAATAWSVPRRRRTAGR